MGTTWSVKWRGETADPAALRTAIEATLVTINAAMSTWDPDSTLARLNASDDTGWRDISIELYQVLAQARAIGAASDGAFDVTVGPLVRLWGFGPDGRPAQVPGPQAIARVRAATGPALFELRANPPAVRKHDPDTEIDLSGIAKGYAVDAVAARLEGMGLQDFMVEIGGEVVARGTRPDGRAWQIGIEQPDPGRRELRRVIALHNLAMATSGDYRNYFEADGQRYSHTLNPLTARPINHNLASVSVLAETCMEADAWATALLVLGPGAGLDKARAAGIAALFIVREADGWRSFESPAFARRLGEKQ